MELFVGERYKGGKNQSFLYLCFDESKKLYRQMEAFQKEYRISGDKVKANDEVVTYLEGERPERIRDIVDFALHDERGNFTYIILKLQSEYNLAFRGMVSGGVSFRKRTFTGGISERRKGYRLSCGAGRGVCRTQAEALRTGLSKPCRRGRETVYVYK